MEDLESDRRVGEDENGDRELKDCGWRFGYASRLKP